MRGLLPNVATFGNLTAGFLALLFVAQGDFPHAAVLVAVAAGFDFLDGAFARRCPPDEPDETGSGLGANLDSLADVVSFGAVPAFALHQAALHELPVAGLAACVVFFACGAWRLARFPLVREPDHFVGLPIPPAGVALAVAAALDPPPLLVLMTTFALAVLMVGTLPFPKPSAMRSPKKRPPQSSP